MRARPVAVVAALLAALAGGCARAEAGVDSPAVDVAADPAVQERWESCEKAAPEVVNRLTPDPDAVGLAPLGDAFRPVSAVICRIGTRERPGGGTEMVAEEVRAVDLTALLPALRLPDEAPTTGPCTYELHVLPWLALLDADGRWVRPGVPVDACGKPRTEFRSAFDELVFD